MKERYEYFAKEKNLLISRQNGIIEKLQLTCGRLQYEISNMMQPKYLLKRFFDLESNPYVTWKLICEERGDSYFHDVFERQLSSFGINYKEINKMLMQTKAYDREFQEYKQNIDD